MIKQKSTLLGLLMLLTACQIGCGEDKKASGNDDTDSSKADVDTDTEFTPDTSADPSHDSDEVRPVDAYGQVPGGLDAADAPMFVALGFDDNGYADGVNWILDFLRDKKNKDADKTPARVTFYLTTGYVHDDTDVYSEYAEPNTGDTDEIVASWRKAYADGHEIGNHTQHHPMGFDKWEAGFSVDDMMTVEQWEKEMKAANEIITSKTQGVGIDASEIHGFRTPFLGYSDETMTAASNMGFAYDCSIEDGWQEEMNATNYPWPYDLKDTSPGDSYTYSWGENKRDAVGPHPGLWEMPVLPLIAPPDYRAEEYGLSYGFRNKCKSYADYFETSSGKVTGFDWNMWDEYNMSGKEALATLKYTLDLHLKGNRAPMTLGVHTDEYTEDNPDFRPKGSTVADRRKAIEDFLTYALSKTEVRVVSANVIVNWVKAHSATTVDTDSDTVADTATDDVDTETDTVTP